MTVIARQLEKRVDLISWHKGTMSYMPLHQPTPDWNLSGINNSRLQLTMDAWEAMSTSGYDRLAGNPTGTSGHDTQLYNNDMVRLKDELQTLATDLRTEKDS